MAALLSTGVISLPKELSVSIYPPILRERTETAGGSRLPCHHHRKDSIRRQLVGHIHRRGSIRRQLVGHIHRKGSIRRQLVGHIHHKHSIRRHLVGHIHSKGNIRHHPKRSIRRLRNFMRMRRCGCYFRSADQPWRS